MSHLSNKKILDVKPCICHVCQLSSRIRNFLDKLPSEIKVEGELLIENLRNEMEDDNTNLEALRLKIAGVWPNDHTGGKYYERINGELYEVHGIKVDENAEK